MELNGLARNDEMIVLIEKFYSDHEYDLPHDLSNGAARAIWEMEEVYDNHPDLFESYHESFAFDNVAADLAGKLAGGAFQENDKYVYSGWCFDRLLNVCIESNDPCMVPIYIKFINLGDYGQVASIQDRTDGNLSKYNILIVVNSCKMSGIDIHAVLKHEFEHAAAMYSAKCGNGLLSKHEQRMGSIHNIALPPKLFYYACELVDLFVPSEIQARAAAVVQAVRNTSKEEITRICGDEWQTYKKMALLVKENDKLALYGRMCRECNKFQSMSLANWWYIGPICNILCQQGAFAQYIKKQVKDKQVKEEIFNQLSDSTMREYADILGKGGIISPPQCAMHIMRLLYEFFQNQMWRFMYILGGKLQEFVE